MKMKKKLISMLIIGTIVFSTTACGGNDSTDNTTDKVTAVDEKPTDLTGTWVSEEKDGSYQEATITDEYMEINWISPDSTSLYWAGSYTAPSDAVDEYSWISQNDKDKTDSALLASTSDTKEFAYKDGVITYEVSALGTTQTYELNKKE